jgi:hypothetical protein
MIAFWESSERSVAIFAGMILGWSGALERGNRARGKGAAFEPPLPRSAA